MNTTHTPEQDLIAAVEQAMPAGTRLGLTDTAHSTVYLHENNRPDRLVTVYLLSRARIAEVFVVNDADRHSVHTPEEIRFDTIAELAEQVADILTRHDREDPTR